MHRLVPVVQPYAWGSRRVIAGLQGRPLPSDGPEAELWLGAHPAGPSHLESAGQQSLAAEIDEDPVGALGAASVAAFGPRLPFLLKVLAVDAPLSLQVHPDARQAAAGFAAEQAGPLPLRDPGRNYRDDQAKPELLVALTPFVALCGFADPAVTADILARTGVPLLLEWAEALHRDGLAALPPLVTSLLRYPADRRRDLVADVTQGARRLVALGGDGALMGAWVQRLARLHPHDPGVAVALLLQLIALRPGEGLFVPAGCLHAYLCGTGVEVMAASDNVLRGGLTPKHVDTDAVLRTLRYSADSPRPLRSCRTGATESADEVWPTPAPEFRLSRLDVAGLAGGDEVVRLPRCGADVLLCTAGTVTVAQAGESLELVRGQAAWVPAGDLAPLELGGAGTLWRATVGL